MDRQAPNRTGHGLQAALAYGLPLSAAYIATGITRTLWLDAHAGPLPGALMEAAVFLALCLAMLASGWQDRAIRQHPISAGTGMLILFLLLDASIAAGLCGVPLARHFSRFTEAHGLIQFTALIFCALLPSFWHDEM
ncbi:Uncharacterised protein [Pannonibacter phragmitetus]|uniref:Uncharacterized protein n=1 Tax=Pannonibacter phragmitetus TaxID=121719 RepID=A0A378ZZS1_9HYPH|nr:hypothetical protein [Pannonibacter phragmitetus]SUB02379.1 Uncharacterised protein [Pannonibacter phragmitetus]